MIPDWEQRERAKQAKAAAAAQREEFKNSLFALVAMAIICAVVYFGVWGYEAFTCHARWSGFGGATRWGVFSGCQVEVGGRWVPERNVRQTP